MLNIEEYNDNLKGRLFGLLCEYEKNRDWVKFLDSILLEYSTFPEDQRDLIYYRVYYKISSLRYLNHHYFRNTIFDCMNLLSK